MIYVNCPTQHDYIIDVLENSASDINFKFESKAGIKLAFSVNTEDLDLAVSTAKSTLKESKLGQALYFQVVK